MRDRMIDLVNGALKEQFDYVPLNKAISVSDELLANGATILPCKVGDTVYKICPKCSDWHDGSCEHCAWRGCSDACDIGGRVYQDGSYNERPLQIVPRRVNKYNLTTILERWNTLFFATTEDAVIAMEEYDSIRKTEDRSDRYKRYLEWRAIREVRFPFLGEE